MRMCRLAHTLLVLFSSVILLPCVPAHHDTEKMIALFTERIKSGEASAELHYRRAVEYRILLQSSKAEDDLHQALEYDPNYTSAHRELAHLLAKRGEKKLAVKAARRAIRASGNLNERSAAMILLARLLAVSGQPKAALRHCRDAFELKPSGEVEWYLLHAELLVSINRKNERPGILAAGYTATHSIVLRNAWVDALLDAGDFKTALPVIEHELSDSRLKSSWRLRHARTQLGLGRTADAGVTLTLCLEELGKRIHPARPDISLIAERGLAQALLGRIDAARNDLNRALAGGADQWMIATLERTLADAAEMDGK
jgi:tetratricopeptide (TPR) repeat protein